MITFFCYLYELQSSLTLSLWAYVLPAFTDCVLLMIGSAIADRIGRR